MVDKKSLVVPTAPVAGIVATAAPKVLRVVAQTEVVSSEDDASGSMTGVSVVSGGLGAVIRVIGAG